MWIFSFLRILLIIYLVALFIALLVCDSLIFPAKPATYTDGEEITKLKSGNGEKISIRYYPNPQAKWTILYSHGNAEDLGTIDPLMREFQERGYAVLAYDYRGYGTSEGKASEENSYKDILTAYEWLIGEKGISPSRIIPMGFSLGGGPTLWLATERPVGAVILQGIFVSAFRVKTRIPLFPFDRFPNLQRVQKLHSPSLFIHGKKDHTVPFWHGETLSSHASGSPRIFWSEEAGHGDFLEVEGERYWKAIETFTEGLSTEVQH